MPENTKKIVQIIPGSDENWRSLFILYEDGTIMFGFYDWVNEVWGWKRVNDVPVVK